MTSETPEPDAPQQDAVIGAPTVGVTARAQQPEAHHREDHIELFRGSDQDWYWRRRAGNGQIVATGGEGYVHRAECVAAAQRVNGPLLLIESIPAE